jgi:hypothetical protein
MNSHSHVLIFNTLTLDRTTRTCNASKTVKTPILADKSSTNSLYGRPSKCSVRLSHLSSSSHTVCSHIFISSVKQSAKCYVRICLHVPHSSVLLNESPRLGFLPVIYAAVRARSNPPIQLATDGSDATDDANPKQKQQELSGYKILLLWFPAACDLTGTTVRLIPDLIPNPTLCCCEYENS